MHKASESREAADISAELRLRIAAEAEKRVFNLATKSLTAQHKAAKNASGKRGKSAAQTPVDAMQSDNTSAPVSATSAAPLLPEFHSAELAPDSAFRSAKVRMVLHSSNFDGAGIGSLFMQDVPNGMLSTGPHFVWASHRQLQRRHISKTARSFVFESFVGFVRISLLGNQSHFAQNGAPVYFRATVDHAGDPRGSFANRISATDHAEQAWTNLFGCNFGRNPRAPVLDSLGIHPFRDIPTGAMSNSGLVVLIALESRSPEGLNLMQAQTCESVDW
ncbi:hypothetical protein K438DRAFT_1751261 [Mycena galopus ATCC 62051]|nr:hypothetical protein K438DRAFT_1751261 [Mycena galopus ATCC 62051]